MTAAVCTVALPLEMIPDNLNTAIKTKAITIALMTCNYAHFASLQKVSQGSFYTSAHSGGSISSQSMWDSSSCQPRNNSGSNTHDLTQVKAVSKPAHYFNKVSCSFVF
jgi:hypothetical protein